MSAALRRPGGIFCPNCRDLTTVDERTGKCLFCDVVVLDGRPAVPGPRGPCARYMSGRLVVDAYDLYLQGLSLRRVAAQILPQTRYANVKSCSVQLAEQWRQLGWPLRGRIAATVAASYRHGKTPRDSALRDPVHRRALRIARGEIQNVQCHAIKTRYGKGRGERCQHFAMLGGTYCRQHEPERRDELCAHLARVRAARTAP